MKKNFIEILKIVCSGLFGVILTIVYQHFFSSPQSFTFIYNGEKIIVSESAYAELVEENNILNDELTEAKQQIKDLLSQIDQQNSSDKSITSSYENNLNSEHINITTLLFDNEKFDNELRTYKDTYGNVLGNALKFSNNGSAVYNLNSEYETLLFLIANSEDIASDKKCVIQFWGDGKLIYTSNFIDYNTKPKVVRLNVSNINKLKIKHYYEYDSSYNSTAGDAIIANISLDNRILEKYDNIERYKGKYMLEELQLFTGSEILSNPLISDTYGRQYECVYSFSNNSSSELLLNNEYSIFKGKIVPSELMNSEKECQIVIETDVDSQTFQINYYTEPIDFEIDLSGSKFLRIKHFYEYDSGMNATAGDAMLVNCYIGK